MGVTFMVVVGAVLGWLTAIVFQIENPRSVLMNIAAGVGGALLAGLVIGPLLGSAGLWGGEYRLGSLLMPLAGSAVLVAVLNLLRRSQLR
jgi:uncharacterized membrane protein YeaQ/YmgE (transglycosylase-associated protein family)